MACAPSSQSIAKHFPPFSKALYAMKKIVLLSNKKYSEESDDFLLSLINQGCELICFVGLDCESWEEAMDVVVKYFWPRFYRFSSTLFPYR